MKAYVTFAAISLVFAASAAQTPTTQPACATTAPAVDPAVRKILDAMETAGKTTRTIRADLSYELRNLRDGSREFRTGWVAYQGKQTVRSGDKTSTSPAMFRVHFETMQLGQLGKGPMPLPFGQKTADMIKYFLCTSRPKRFSDPKDTVYLNLVPRKTHAKNLDTIGIQMWVSTKDYLPVKIITRDKSKNKITCWFDKTRINTTIKKSLFRFPKPLGWKLIVQPFKAGQNFKP